MTFTLAHLATLLKYTGISFIAGSVTHGAFSGKRSIITAVLGVTLYSVGTVLERRANPDKNISLTKLLAIGIVASIGLGFFTGGLQHFPDSPFRSLWVVPLGFVMSFVAVYLSDIQGHVSKKELMLYGLGGFLSITLLSFVAHEYFEHQQLENNGMHEGDYHHHHDDEHHHNH